MSGFNIIKFITTFGWLVLIVGAFSGYLAVGMWLLDNHNLIFGMGWLAIPTIFGVGCVIYGSLPDEKNPSSDSSINHEYDGEEDNDGW